MRFRHTDQTYRELFTVVAFMREFVISFKKIGYVTFVYCKEKDGTPRKFKYEEILRYE